MSIGQYRIQIADHFAMVRNQVDIFTETMIQSFEKNEPEKNKEKEKNALNADRDKILSELAIAEKNNLSRLEKMDLCELSNLNDIQLGEKLFQPFLFCFMWNEKIRLVIVSDGYLTQNQISFYQTIVKNQKYDYAMSSHDDDEEYEDDDDEEEDDEDEDEDEEEEDEDKDEEEEEKEDEEEHENGSIGKCAKWWEPLFNSKDTQVIICLNYYY